MLSNRSKKKIYLILVFSFVFIIFFYFKVGSYLNSNFKSFSSSFFKNYAEMGIPLDSDQRLNLENLKRENLELKSLLQIKDSDSFNIVFTKIIFSHPSFLNQSFTVPLGSEDGITKNQFVFSSKGFLGKVAKVMSNYSEVITLENINFNLIVEVGDAKFKGILKGNGYGSQIEYIDDTSDINIGDNIYIYSPIQSNLLQKPIGKVSDIRKNSGFLYLTVASPLVFNSISYVGIVKIDQIK